MKQKISSPAVLVPITILAVAVAGLAAIAYVGQSDDELDFAAAPTAVPATQQPADGTQPDTSREPSAAASADSLGGEQAPAANDRQVLIDPEDQPLEPAEFDRVVAAALEIAGGGTVTEVDRSDDLGETYEVEVVTDVGELDIALDQNLDRVANLRYDD